MNLHLPQEMLEDLINLLDELDELPDVLRVLLSLDRPPVDLASLVRFYHLVQDISTATADHCISPSIIEWTKVYCIISRLKRIPSQPEYETSGWMPYRGDYGREDMWYVNEYDAASEGARLIGYYHYKTDYFTPSNDDMIAHVAEYIQHHHNRHYDNSHSA